MQRLVFLGGGALAMSLGMAACTGDDGDGDGGGSTVAGTAGTASPDDGDDDGDDGDDGDDDGAMTSTTSVEPDTGAVDDTAGAETSGGTADDTGDDTGTDATDGDPLCGNGVVDEGEGCDEPNGMDADGCNEDCTLSGAIVWSHTQASGLGASEDYHGVAVDADGNAFVTGTINNDVAGADLFVRQYTAEGGLGWSVSVDGTSMVADGGRDAVVVGDSLYAVGFLNTSLQSNNWRVAQYALGGGPGFLSSYNGAVSGSDVAEAIAADAAGNLYVAGRQAVDLAGQNVHVRQYLAGGADGWTASYASAGTGDDRALSVAVDPAGNVVVAGFETVTAQGRNGWVRKYDPAGTALWTMGYQGVEALDDQANGITTDAAGNVFVAGHESTVLQGTIGWVRRYDPEGVEAWTQTWPGTTGQGASLLDITIDAASNLVVVGSETVGANSDGLVRKYDTSGSVLWSETYGTDADANQVIRSVTIGPADRIWIAGGLNLGIDGRDAWVAQIAP